MGKSSVEDTTIEESFGNERGAREDMQKRIDDYQFIHSGWRRSRPLPPVSYGENRCPPSNQAPGSG